MITAHNARSTRRRGSSSEGRNEPTRTLGIRSCTSPAGVDSVLDRPPLRWFVLDSVRSCGAAPIAALSSSSINSCSAMRTTSRNSSLVSPSASTSANAADSRASSTWAIVWHLLYELCGRNSLRVTRWPALSTDPPPTSTTRWDAYAGRRGGREQGACSPSLRGAQRARVRPSAG